MKPLREDSINSHQTPPPNFPFSTFWTKTLIKMKCYQQCQIISLGLCTTTIIIIDHFQFGKKSKSLWQFLQEFCHMYFLPPRNLPFNYEKVKVCYGKVKIVIIGDQKSMINLTQFESTVWAKRYTQWQWSNILKMMTLV